MINFKEEAIALKEEMISLRRKIHMNPELGMEEYETSKLIKEFLTQERILYKEVANTGVCAIIKGEKDKNDKTIALRADIDALPIIDEKSCDYKSKVEGKMHACGHDAHTTILLITAKILNKYKKDFSGNVKLLFEPAEETVGGARFMIAEGVLDCPKVNVISGLHVEETLECGKIMVKNDVVNAASNPFSIRIIGSGGHGAAPQYTVDPIIIAANVIMAIQNIISREISPLDSALITVASIHGGTAQNIIPNEVKLKGIIRTLSAENRKYIIERFSNLVNGICESFKGKAIINIEESYPCLYNNEAMVNNLKEAAKKVIGEENIVIQEKPKMGVESFAYFANERPAVFYFLGSNKKNGVIYPAHSSLFDIDEECLTIGVAIQCEIAFNYLTANLG